MLDSIRNSSLPIAGTPPPRVRWIWLMRGLTIVFTLLAILLLYRTLSRYEFDELVAAIAAVPLSHLFAAIGWAAASYLCLTGFDWLGLTYVGCRLPYRKVAFTSFVSLSLGHNIGFAGLSSGAIRYRYYSREGLKVTDVARLIVFCGITVSLGLLVLAAIAVLARPAEAGKLLGLGAPALVALGVVCLLIPLAYVGLAWILHRPIVIYRWVLEIPSVKIALGQIALGTLNFACVAACLHQTLAAFLEVPYLTTAAIYVLANTAGLITHVPGGLGVIESVVVYLVPGSGVLPLVLVFRSVYFLLPLAIGSTLFLVTELRLRTRHA
jgi:uncharacterized membrane protein YbhN (UPF0104 family)